MAVCEEVGILVNAKRFKGWVSNQTLSRMEALA